MSLDTKIYFLYNFNYKDIKKYKINKITKVILLDKFSLERINTNKSIAIKNNNSNIFKIKEYLKISDKIILIVKNNYYSIKKMYKLIKLIYKKIGIDENKIIVVIKKEKNKKAIHHLIVKEIFKKYNMNKIKLRKK